MNNSVVVKTMENVRKHVDVKPVTTYVGLLILEISKIAMYKFYYEYVKLKHDSKAKLCYMDTDSFIIHLKTENIYDDIANCLTLYIMG